MKLKIILLILIVGGVYFVTLAPDIYLEDSGELVSAAYFLGIPHPSGYPLYALLGKLFTFLPFGTIAFRVNLMSAVFGVGTAVVLFLAMLKLGRILGKQGRALDWLAFSLALLFALSQDFWSQAIVAEVYTLNTFLVGILLLVLFDWWEEPSSTKKLYGLAFISGLGLTNHLLFGLVLPVVWGIIVVKQKIKFKQVFKLLLLFVLGASVYLYIPIRAATGPVLNFNHVTTFKDSIDHILRTYYNDTGFALKNKGAFWLDIWLGLSQNLSLVILACALLALPVLYYKRQIELLVLLLGGALASAVLPFLLRDVQYSLEASFAYRVYLFQAYIFFLLLAFCVLSLKAFSQKILVPAFLILIALTVYVNYPKINLRHNLTADYYTQKLESFPHSAIYILVGEGYDYDSELFSLYYLQKVKNFRPDVQIIDATRFFYSANNKPGKKISNPNLTKLRRQYLEHVIKTFGSGRPILASFPAEPYVQDLGSRPTGFALEIVPKNELPPKIYLDKDLGKLNLEHERQTWDLAYQDFLAATFYQKAMYAVTARNIGLMTEYITAAIKFDNEVSSEDYKGFQAFREANY